MIEAYSRRDLERRSLLEKLMRLVSRLEDEEGDRILFETIHLLVESFQAKKENQYNDFLMGKAISMHGEAYELVFNEILPKIDSFARAPEEANVLVADLLKKIISWALSSFYAELTHLENINSQLIFHAESAMAEVEMPDDD